MGTEASTTAFTAEMQDRLFFLEERSWWFRYRAKLVVDIVKRYMPAGEKVYDVGGANGFITKKLQDQGIDSCLIEPSVSACEHAAARGVKNIRCGVLSEESAADESIDNVLLLDVLEHMEDDAGFMAMLHAKLRHYVLITVPAYQHLFSQTDKRAHHYKKTLAKVVEDSGFSVCYLGYIFSFMYLPVLAVRILIGERKPKEAPNGGQAPAKGAAAAGKKPQKSYLLRTGVVERILNGLCDMEFRWVQRGRKLPFGSSVICLAKKD